MITNTSGIEQPLAGQNSTGIPPPLAAPDSAYTAPTYSRGKPNEPDHLHLTRCDWCTQPITDQHPGIWNQPQRILNLDIGSSHSPTRSHVELSFYSPPRTQGGHTVDLARVQLHATCVADIGDTIADWFRTIAKTKIK